MRPTAGAATRPLGLVSLCVAVLTALTLTAAPAPAAAPTAMTGELAYSRGTGGAPGEVWTSGPPPRPLSDTAVGVEPEYRPDGQRIVFSDLRDLYTVSADGTDTVQLTDDAAADRAPTYTPDGRAVLFHRTEANGGTNVYYLPLTATGLPGRALARVTAGTDPTLRNEQPAVSPDGTRLLFETNRLPGGFALFSMRLARESTANPARLLTQDSTEGAWSPDGALVLYTRGPSIWQVQSDGGGNRLVTQLAGAVNRSASWSTDGNHIAFVRIVPGGDNADIYVIQAAQESRRNPAVNVTNTPADEATPDWRPGG